MRKLLAVALATPIALVVASPASAQPPPPPIMCGGEAITVEVVKDTTRFHPRPFGFSVTGNAILRLADSDSSVDVRVPGRLAITDDPETGIRTIVLSGRNLLLPETEGQRSALAEAGLPEVALILGRVVLTEEVDAQGAVIPGSEEVVRFTPHVIDVCALLAE